MNEELLRKEFESRTPVLQALGDFVTRTVMDALALELKLPATVGKFLQIPPKPRVKEVDSFLEKLVRKPKENPFTDITDQVGVRFVVLLLEDIDCIGRIVKGGPWHWQKDRDFEDERLQNPDYFAYQSDHFVIRTNTDTVFNGVTIPAGFSCEIQVRTILQHAYAEMAHSSDYKPAVKLPDEDKRRVKRALAKGSALIETTDDVFREIKVRLREYGESVAALLDRAREIYLRLSGEDSRPDTSLSKLVVESYRDLLKGLTPNDLDEWVANYPSLADEIKEKRSESVFFRDSIIVLLGLLISRSETTIPKRWPLDSRYLQELYTILGVSSSEYF